MFVKYFRTVPAYRALEPNLFLDAITSPTNRLVFERFTREFFRSFEGRAVLFVLLLPDVVACSINLRKLGRPGYVRHPHIGREKRALFRIGELIEQHHYAETSSGVSG